VAKSSGDHIPLGGFVQLGLRGIVERTTAEKLFAEALKKLWLFFNPMTEHIGHLEYAVSCRSSIWWRSR
jgi:hypothetical protein